MSLKSILLVSLLSFIVSVILVLFGIFGLNSMTVPGEGISHGFVLEMLQKPEFIAFHCRAFLWLFSASCITGVITLFYASKRNENT